MITEKSARGRSVKNKPSFESFGFEEEGRVYWWASWYAGILGYHSLHTFMAAVGRAMQLCSVLDLNVQQNFIETHRVAQGRRSIDFKLTRFACYLLAMLTDDLKPMAQRAKAHFSRLAKRHLLQLNGVEDLERVLLREEIKEGHHLLSESAYQAGVRDYRFFMNEGYQGMYQRNTRTVRTLKGLDQHDSLFDHILPTEMAANLQRIRRTAAQLKKSEIHSAFEAAAIHRHIGADIRTKVKRQTGRFPEDLLPCRRLSEVVAALRKAEVAFHSAHAE